MYKVSKEKPEVSQSQVQDCVSDSEVGSAEKTVMGSGYALTQIKKVSAWHKGFKSEGGEVFPSDLRLFLDSVRFYRRSSDEPGQPGLPDQELVTLIRLVLKVITDKTKSLFILYSLSDCVFSLAPLF